MAPEENSRIEDARTAASESIPALLASADENVLRALIENPSLDETHICLLLERKDLPGTGRAPAYASLGRHAAAARLALNGSGADQPLTRVSCRVAPPRRGTHPRAIASNAAGPKN